MQVPLRVGCSEAGGVGVLVDARPGGPAEDGAPVVRRLLAVRLAVAEHVAGTLGAAGACGERSLEPHVLVRGVVGDEVDDDAEAERMGALEERVEVCEGPEERVHVAVVGDVVPAVGLW